MHLAKNYIFLTFSRFQAIAPLFGIMNWWVFAVFILIFLVDQSSNTSDAVQEGLVQFCKQHNISMVVCNCDYIKDICRQLKIKLGLKTPMPKVEANGTAHLEGVVFASIAVGAAFISILGNTLVVAVAVTHGRNITKFKRMIAILAFYDLVFSILALIREIPKFWTNYWLYGLIPCKILSSADLLGGYVAIYVIVIISIERYFGIVYPLSTTLKGWMVHTMEIANVLLGLVAILPVMIFTDIDQIKHRCRLVWPNSVGRHDSKIYRWFEVIFYNIFPAAVIVSLYCHIMCHLHHSSAKVELYVSNQQRKQRHRENKRVSTILIMLLVCFVVFVTPSHISLLLLDYLDKSADGQRYMGVNETVYTVLSYMTFTYPVHTAVNPIVYSFIDAKWRRDVLKLFFRHRQIFSSTISRSTVQTAKLSTTSATVLKDHDVSKIEMKKMRQRKITVESIIGSPSERFKRHVVSPSNGHESSNLPQWMEEHLNGNACNNISFDNEVIENKNTDDVKI